MSENRGCMRSGFGLTVPNETFIIKFSTGWRNQLGHDRSD
jgi:hypothetical protein